MMVKGDIPVCLARWDWLLVSILTFIICRTTPSGYVPALKRTRKSKARLDNLKGKMENNREQLQIGERACLYSAGARFDTF